MDRALSFQREHYRKPLRAGGPAVTVLERNHMYDQISRRIVDRSFKDFAEEAYASRNGYKLRINPETGEKELFIAGTRGIKDWAANLIDFGGSFYGNEKYTHRGYVSELQNIIDIEKPHVVYGHSRGAALMSRLKGDHLSIGLDAARIISNHNDYLNIRKAGPIDSLLSLDFATVKKLLNSELSFDSALESAYSKRDWHSYNYGSGKPHRAWY